MALKQAALNRHLQERLQFIDTVVEHYGWITRKILQSHFHIGGHRATEDIAQYKALAPNNLTMNESTKRYERTATFSAVYGNE